MIDAITNPKECPLRINPENNPLIFFGTVSIVITEPLAHSPPANNP